MKHCHISDYDPPKSKIFKSNEVQYEYFNKNDKIKCIEQCINNFWDDLIKLSIVKEKEKPTLEELLDYIELVKLESRKEVAMELKNFIYNITFNLRNDHINLIIKKNR